MVQGRNGLSLSILLDTYIVFPWLESLGYGASRGFTTTLLSVNQPGKEGCFPSCLHMLINRDTGDSAASISYDSIVTYWVGRGTFNGFHKGTYIALESGAAVPRKSTMHTVWICEALKQEMCVK